MFCGFQVLFHFSQWYHFVSAGFLAVTILVSCESSHVLPVSSEFISHTTISIDLAKRNTGFTVKGTNNIWGSAPYF